MSCPGTEPEDISALHQSGTLICSPIRRPPRPQESPTKKLMGRTNIFSISSSFPLKFCCLQI